ncbi:hypothetical protein [Streptomyces sp. NPDC055607]
MNPMGRTVLIVVGAMLMAGTAACRSTDHHGGAAPGPPVDVVSPTTGSEPTPTSASGPPGADRAARTVVDAPVAGGLRRTVSPSDVPVDPGDVRAGMHLVVARYRSAGDVVLFEGVDNVPEDTSRRREHLFRGMLDHLGWDYAQGQPAAEAVPAGRLGGSVECALVPRSGGADVVCGWADSGTAAVAHFPRSTPREAGALFVKMRDDLEK